MGLLQSQTLTGTDPLPLLSLLQTGEADGRRAVPKLESASFATSLSAISLITDDQKDQLLIRFLILWSNLFCFTCMYAFIFSIWMGKGQNLQKSVLVFQWPLEWQAQRCTTSPRSWEVSHFVYAVEISWISNNFVVGWLKSVKNLMCFIYNLLHRFVCWDYNVKQKYIQGHYNHEGVLDGK